MLVTTAVVLPLLSVRLHYELLVLASRVVRAVSGSGRAGVAPRGDAGARCARHRGGRVRGRLAVAAARRHRGALRTRADAARRLLLLGRGLHGVYTSLGFGDIVPLSNGRLLVVVETLTGLVLIAWTATRVTPPVFERLRPTLPGRVPAEDDPKNPKKAGEKHADEVGAQCNRALPRGDPRQRLADGRQGSRSPTRWASATSRSSSETATAGPPGSCRSRAAAAEGRPCSPATARVSAANSACCASRTSARAPRSR